MEYKQMTKDDLITKLMEQEHLSDAVKAKDLEIATVRSENDRLNKLVKTQEHLSSAVKAKDVEISDLNKQLSTALESYGEKIKRLQDENEKLKINFGVNAQRDLDYENLLQKYKVSEALLDVYKKLLRNTLQSAQGMIDMSINSMSQLELMEGGKLNG